MRAACTGDDFALLFGDRGQPAAVRLRRQLLSARWGPFWGQRPLLNALSLEGGIRPDRTASVLVRTSRVPEERC